MKTNHLIILSALAITQLFSSCKKETVEKVTPKYVATEASVQATAADKAYVNSVIYKTVLLTFGASMGDVNAFKNDDVNDILSACATITIDSSSSPNHVTIDFGTSGCTLNDGTPVTGVITGTYTDPKLGNPNATASLDMTAFYINGNQILGNFYLHNKGVNGSGNLDFDLVISGGSLVFGSDGRIVKQNVNWLVEWQRNGNTNKDDDFFSFSGTTSGVTSDGDAYTEVISQPLLISRAPNCVRQFVSGVSDMTIAGQPDLSINYGDGTCDTRAEISQGGVNTRIELRAY